MKPFLRTGVSFSASGNSTMPVVSGDGRWVIFVSRAPNLVDRSNNG